MGKKKKSKQKKSKKKKEQSGKKVELDKKKKDKKKKSGRKKVSKKHSQRVDSKKKKSKKDGKKGRKSTAIATITSPSKPAAIGKIAKAKIDDLFSYRLLLWLLGHSKISEQDAFLRKLKALQTKIYLLDHYLETTWDLDEKMLTAFWEAIYEDLEAFDLSRAEAVNMCKQIEKYQSHERSMRDKKSPTRFSIRHFYYYKSCDVKLMRSLIYLADPSLQRIVRRTDWTDFDLITEVNDDIADLQEDLEIYNANRFMFQLKETGKTNTGEVFQSFLNEIEAANHKRFEGSKSENAQHISQSTALAIKETSSLLRQQLQDADLVQIKLAKVFSEFPL